MPVTHYRELIAWQKAMDLAAAVYKQTLLFPKEELYGLSAQLRRAAVSVPSNIAEGQGRSTTNDFLHFLGIAMGSLQEMETQLILAGRLMYVEESCPAQLLDQCTEVSRLLHGLANSLRRRSGHSPLTTSH